MNGKLPETGIEIIEGRPGSGKSLMAVKRAARVAICRDRRPVYTNLPIRWRSMRTFLRRRGGDDLVRLMRPLTKRHFDQFMDRYVERTEFLKLLKLTQPGLSRAALLDAWYRKAGADVVDTVYRDDGTSSMLVSEGNWIPPGSVIVIDEAQQWYPNPHLKNVSASEPESMMKYLTMHRHLAHWVWFLTQHRRQVSPTIKSLASKVCVVRDCDDDRAAWGLRWRYLGLKVLAYRWYTPEQEDTDEPFEVYNDVVNLPWERHWFRLYDSFTHFGSRREINAGLRVMREGAGLSGEGVSSLEVDMSKRRSSWPVRLTRWLFRKTIKLAVLVGLIMLAFHVGGAGEGVVDEVDESEVSEAIEAAVISGREQRATSMSPRIVRFADGVAISVGGGRAGLELVAVRPALGLSAWRDGDDLWLWRVGFGAQRVGDFRAAVRAAAADAGGAGSDDGLREADASASSEPR